MSGEAVHYVPIVTTILAVIFSAEIFRRYREQFQFAPARGRSFTVGLNVGAF